MRKITCILFIVLANLILAACVPQPTTTATPIPRTPSKTAAPSPTATSTHTPTATNTSTRTKVPTYTPKPLGPSKTSTPDITATITHLLAQELPDECGTVNFGYPGTQSWENSDQIILSGTAILCTDVILINQGNWPVPLSESQLDLDNGVIGFSEEADIKYNESGGSMLFYGLFSINNAKGTRWSYTFDYPPEPGFEECRDQIDTYQTDDGPNYLCVITTEGNISRVKLEEYSVLDDYYLSIKISFITWAP